MNDQIRSKHVEQTKNCGIKIDYMNCASRWLLTHNSDRFVVLNSVGDDCSLVAQYGITIGKYTGIWYEVFFRLLDPEDEGNAFLLDIINYVYFPVVMM